MSRRERRLDEVIAQYGIESSYDDTTTAKRYVAVLEALIEGEQSAASSFDTLEEACEWLASGYQSDYPRRPACVVDLDTGQRFTPEQVHVSVTLGVEGAEGQRNRNLAKLREHYGATGANLTFSTHTERYAAVSRELWGVKALDNGAVIGTWPSEREAFAALGTEMLESYTPEAVYDLDTGKRIEIHVPSPAVSRSPDKGTMENPLEPDGCG